MALDSTYGPTDQDPDAGKRWHIGCGGEIWGFREGEICTECDASSDWPPE